MNQPRRLSLRARLLVLLVAVTAAFLLIMGGVTAVVLNQGLGRQFRADLLAAAARSPQAIAADPGGYLAVALSPSTGQSVLLTPGAAGTRLRQALSRLSRPQLLRDYYRQPFPVTLSDGTTVQAVTRPAAPSQATGLGLPAGRVMLVVARQASRVAAPVRGVVLAELITGGVLLLLLAAGGRRLIGRGLSPLAEMATTAHQITTRGDLAARMPQGSDGTEVGRLGSAINTMLDRIQQAFTARLRSEEKVRQFAADASHELRTPLTTIRGYAELYRQGALGPGQLPDAMRRIEQEAQRMSTLVAELLELARLDRGSSLDLADADLAGMVRDAVADARAVEPGRPVQAEAPDRLVALVDEARVRQVLANLLGNVREHTPPGTPASVRLAQVRGGVVLEVADAGPGMPPQAAARAFDRFARGDGQPGADGGHQDAGQPGRFADAVASAPGNGADAVRGGGSGLGLSIVQAIAQAHGGQAVLESWPGQGTRVRIWLPAAVQP